MSDTSSKTIRIVQKIFFPLELIGIILIFLRFLLENNQDLISGIGFVWLALLYFLSVFFRTTEGMSFLLGLARKITGLGASLTTIGLMFSFLEISGARNLLTAGVAILIIALMFTLIEMLRKPSLTTFVKFTAVRGLIIAVVGAIILYFREM